MYSKSNCSWYHIFLFDKNSAVLQYKCKFLYLILCDLLFWTHINLQFHKYLFMFFMRYFIVVKVEVKKYLINKPRF